VAPGFTGACDAQGYNPSPYQQDYPPDSAPYTHFFLPPYPPAEDTYNIRTKCNNFSRTPTDANASSVSYALQAQAVVCPYPLVIPADPNAPTLAGGVCGLPCPILVFSEEDYNNVDILQTTLVVISFLFSVWTASTWIIFKQKRAQKYVLYFNVSIVYITVILLSFVIYRGGGKHVAHMGCKDNSQTYDTNGWNWCIVGGAMVVFGVMHSVSWWLISALDLFLKIVLQWRPMETSKANKAKELFYRINAPLIPAILVFIALGENIMGAADLGVAWCQFHARNPDHPDLEWFILYFPVLIVAVFGFFFMTSIMVSLCRSAQATGTNRRKGWWKRYLRPIVFLGAFLIIFIWIFAFRVSAWYQTQTWIDNAKDWVECLLVDGPVGLRQCAPDKPPGGPSVVLWNLIHVAVAGTGIYTFMIYGIMEENFRLWAKLLGDCCNCDGCRVWGAGAVALRHRASTVQGPKKGSKGNDAVKLGIPGGGTGTEDD